MCSTGVERGTNDNDGDGVGGAYHCKLSLPPHEWLENGYAIKHYISTHCLPTVNAKNNTVKVRAHTNTLGWDKHTHTHTDCSDGG